MPKTVLVFVEDYTTQAVADAMAPFEDREWYSYTTKSNFLKASAGEVGSGISWAATVVENLHPGQAHKEIDAFVRGGEWVEDEDLCVGDAVDNIDETWWVVVLEVVT